jgi:hypothetical protein
MITTLWTPRPGGTDDHGEQETRRVTALVEFPAEARKPGHWTLRVPVD